MSAVVTTGEARTVESNIETRSHTSYEAHTAPPQNNMADFGPQVRKRCSPARRRHQSIHCFQSKFLCLRFQPEVEQEVISLHPIGPGIQNLEPEMLTSSSHNSSGTLRPVTPSFPVQGSRLPPACYVDACRATRCGRGLNQTCVGDSKHTCLFKPAEKTGLSILFFRMACKCRLISFLLYFNFVF